MFSATLIAPTQALRSGSSGRQRAVPADLARAWRGRARRRCGPRRRSRSRWPASTSTSSRWPLPETPAMPTISPGPDGRARHRAAPAGRASSQRAQTGRRRAAARRTRPMRARRLGRTPGAPIIMLAMASGVRSADAPPPASLPRRSTVTSSANAITSRNLCVIISTVSSPRAHHVAQQARAPRRPPAASAPRSARRGSGSARLQVELLEDLELLLLAGARSPRPWRRATRNGIASMNARARARLACLQSMTAGSVGARQHQVLGHGHAGTSVKCW